MNAKEARQIALQNRDLTKYVEDAISEEVRSFAEEGDFECEVFIHMPGWSENRDEFMENAKHCLEKLGYEVLDCDRYDGGFSYNISWENSK